MALLWRLRTRKRDCERSRAPVMARIEGEPDGYRRVGDIGTGGFRVNTELSLQAGERIPVKLQFPDLWEEIEVEARVAWASKRGEVGLDVRDLDPDDTELLGVMIAHQEVYGRMAMLC
jgi:hypothetical protein